jgi:hypothetical protein
MRFVLGLVLSTCALANSPAKLLDTAPIRFEQHGGAWVARGVNHSISFTNRATTISLADRTVSLTFPGSSRAAGFTAADATVPTNYFRGTDHTIVPTFRRLRRNSLYKGIDLVYYGNGGELEYDFEIAPGANPSAIRMRFEGADRVSLNDRGEIVLTLGDGQVIQRTPAVYQRRASGEIVSIPSSYRVDQGGDVHVELGQYDRASSLIVDPSITFTAYLEGSQTDIALAVAHDSNGNIYLAGNTWSTDFPVTPDAYQGTNLTNQDVWVMKINPAGGANAIVYCTYLGSAATDTLKAMTVDSSGVMYLTGSTDGGAFPVSPSAYQSTISSNTHAFVTVLDTTQSTSGLIYSSFLGGSNNEEGDAITVANGKVYVTGFTTSDNFPTVNPTQSARVAGYDGFISELDPTQSGSASLVFSTYLGASAQDLPHAIAVDSKGNIYVAGITYSPDFPTSPLSYQPFYIGDGDGFLTVINPTLQTIQYSTLLGGAFTDDVKRIVIEPSGHVALTGYTLSKDFPISQGAYQNSFNGISNAFLTILDPTAGTPLVQGLVYSTYFGGTGGEVALDMRRDPAGRYIIAGYTLSTDLPVTAGAFNSNSAGAGPDGFIAVFDPTKPPYSPQQLVYSSYVTSPGFQVVYGLDVDASGTIYATGFSTSQLFPNGVQNPTVGKMSAFLFTFTLQ